MAESAVFEREVEVVVMVEVVVFIGRVMVVVMEVASFGVVESDGVESGGVVGSRVESGERIRRLPR